MAEMQRQDLPQPFSDPSYLGRGSAAQQSLFTWLQVNGMLRKLARFTPLLAGTFPLDIQVTGSDLDILCCFISANRFSENLVRLYGKEPGFSLREMSIRGIPSVVCNFHPDPYPVEIFGQPVPVSEQMGYLHLVKEAEILDHEGPVFREKIILLKRAGIKTEPAFCQLLGLQGDPYTAILSYSSGSAV